MAREMTETCFSILGSSTYLEDNRHNKIANDLQAFNWWEGTDEMLAFHITISGIGYASESMQVHKHFLWNYRGWTVFSSGILQSMIK